MPGTFRFKRFEMENSRSAMKVNTDGVLLGAAASLPSNADGRDISALDIGTGGGTIALMLAQRLSDAGAKDFHVTGIDIDGPSVEEAAANFAASPWSKQLDARRMDVRKCDGIYDMIVSNPPFYDASLPAPDGRRNAARHGADGEKSWLSGEPCSYVTVLDFAKGHLAADGLLSIVLPADQEKALTRYAASCGLCMAGILHVSTTPSKPCKRIVAELSFHTQIHPREETLAIQGASGEYTAEYRALVSPFYLWA